MMLCEETSRSRGSTGAASRALDVDGTRGFVDVEADSCSREGAFRRRGLTTLSLEDCRFSLEGEERTPARGTGSLEGRGTPLGLVFAD
jgi:hypothetical protein